MKSSINGLLAQLEKYMDDGDIEKLLVNLEGDFLNLSPELKKAMLTGTKDANTKTMIDLVSKSSGLKTGNPIL